MFTGDLFICILQKYMPHQSRDLKKNYIEALLLFAPLLLRMRRLQSFKDGQFFDSLPSPTRDGGSRPFWDFLIAKIW